MNLISVIMPVYGVEKYIKYAIESVLNQSYSDFELIIVDDQSPDNSIAIARSYQDPRIRIIQQKNLGLSGARNTGIHHAQGQFLAFLDADDYWAADKLHHHLEHLLKNSNIGVSYCPSIFIDDDNNLLGIQQNPKLEHITLEEIFCRNPIGNGSAPVIRASVFEDIGFQGKSNGHLRTWYFDETLKQSEDIDCWLRIATETNWIFAGIAPALSYYRVNDTGLSANVVNQFDSWKRARKHLQTTAPDSVAKWGNLAEAYQLRYLSRRAIRSRDAVMSLKLIQLALKTNYRILFKEPKRTLNTLICAVLLNTLPLSVFCQLEKTAMNSIGLLKSCHRE